MAREIEKGHGKREEKGCENVTDKDDLNTADKQLTLSCVDLRITTAQHLNETRKAPPSALKHEGNSRIKLVVLTGACYNIFVALGFPFAIGALYLEILDTFNSTRGETSLVPAFCLGCTFGVGFLSGFFIQRCGMKTVMVAGGLVSSLGLFTSWFPQSVVHLIVTVGVINGISLMFLGASTEWSMLTVLTSTAGAGIGGMTAMLPVVSLEVLSQEMLPFGLGFCGMINGDVTPVLGTVIGLVFDNRKSYEVPLYVFGSIAVGGAALTMMVFISLECRCNKKHVRSMIRL
ncbi:monocarboxylate transporter 14-like isoform X2 [Haliotis rufescens]|uniref:monocarboxylate transporter 14-like isoform X2 n=1 Tax=Haliotis rufescens TaxID=6454 RepID=UPI00201ED519|nr:monocarboxylate transporter 14-like isoform X2 [Haliotis rufescens]